MLHDIVNYIVSIIGDLGYIGILIMMIIESSFLPFPSEIAMIPAGYLASIGKMNFIVALLIGTLGGLIGASINYFIGKYFGNKIVKNMIKKFGKYFFLNEKHFNISEKYFEKHGSITTFSGRFIPAIRQLISLPAGIHNMNISKFLFFTGLGAGIWNLILMSIGYLAGENQELIKIYSKEALMIMLFFTVFTVFIYYYKNKTKNKII